MEEEFNYEEEKSNSRVSRTPVMSTINANPSNVPFYSTTPTFTPYPTYIQPNYRSYHPNCHCHNKCSHVNPYQNPNMQSVQMDATEHQSQMYDLCKRYQFHFVQLEGTDGHNYDGIIESVDNENVYMLEPVGDMERENQDEGNRQFGDYGYGYGGFPYGYGYPRRFRRFRRRRFPFFFFRRLFFPYFY